MDLFKPLTDLITGTKKRVKRRLKKTAAKRGMVIMKKTTLNKITKRSKQLSNRLYEAKSANRTLRSKLSSAAARPVTVVTRPAKVRKGGAYYKSLRQPALVSAPPAYSYANDPYMYM